VVAIKKFQWPVDTKELQSFLGLVDFYQRFIPGMVCIFLPLTDLFCGGKQVKLSWSADMAKAFELAKPAMCLATLLCHPDPQATANT
jgi:hypothetical protein